MKNCLIVLFVFVALNVCAQKTFELKDLFTAKTVVWYGIDYSKTSFVGPFMGKDLNIYFHAWNSLIIEEPRKYNVARSMYKASVINDISTIEKINAATIPILSHEDSVLTKVELANMVSKYIVSQPEGLGLVLIAESYNRKINLGSHYAVVFDIASKKILISQKFIATTGGLGVRNYWGFSIYETLNMLSDRYRKWKYKYSK